MTKTFTHYPCVMCGLPVSNAGFAHKAHLNSAKHHAGVMRNILRKLVETVPQGCMHVGTDLIESALHAIRDASVVLDAKPVDSSPMSPIHDLPTGWNYVAAGLIWHVAQDISPAKSSETALCGKRGHWTHWTRGRSGIGKLCRPCRTAWWARS